MHPTATSLLDWLRHRPMALFENGWLMVHAGVLPQWDVADTLARAHELQSALRSSDWTAFLQHMYGNEPALLERCAARAPTACGWWSTPSHA